MAVSNRLNPSQTVRYTVISPENVPATAEGYLDTSVGLAKKTWLEKQRQVTPTQIVRLAAAMSANKMAAIAYGYMDITDETIKNIKYENKDDAEAFNREIILLWTKKRASQGLDQVDNLAQIFYTAERECGAVDPNKVEEILGIPVPRPSCENVSKTNRSKRVNPRQVVCLSAAISVPNMLSIAKSYMMITKEKLQNLKSEYEGEALNREIIKHWIKSHLKNTTFKLASLLYRACDYVGWEVVEDVLGVGRPVEIESQATEVTWEDFLHFACIVRQWTEKAMKIEVAPWIRDYVANMEELYTKLILEKIKNRQLNEEIIPLEDYVDLFNDSYFEEFYFQTFWTEFAHKNAQSKRGWLPTKQGIKQQVNRQKSREKQEVFSDKAIQVDKGQVKKILGKGIPGIGKTTLLKKIGWDWAKGIFTNVELLFVVLLKIVKPKEAIEDAILAQMPQLEGLGITPKFVKSILDTFGHKCLLILDGLDEHVLGQNEDVVKIIKGQKYLNCNVFVTSRPHSTSTVEGNFSTIVRIEGFGRKEAAIFAEKLLHDKEKVEMVLNFEHAEFTGNNSLYKSPILLSFMCLLVKEDLLDLTDTQIKIGEIYTRMVRCLYKKYTIRKNKEYTFKGFVKSITLVGKLALKTLLSGVPFMKRKDILKEVGEEAFDYGLIIGHEDAHLLIRDETADIFVTFSHRSIQEFLGAFCLIRLLNEGKTLEMLVGNELTSKLFHQTPLFLHFCVWLCSDQTYFRFENTGRIRESLAKYVSEQVFEELNVPSFDITDAYNKNDEMRLSFFRDVLAKCNKVRIVVLDPRDPVDWVLTSMRPVLKGITTVHVRGVLHVGVVDGSEIILHIKQWGGHLVNSVLKHCSHSTEYPSVHLHVEFEKGHTFDLSELLRTKFKGLRIVGSQKHVLVAKGKLRFSPVLTALTFDGITVAGETLVALSKANETCSLPSLRHLSFIKCTGFKSHLRLLFQTPWRELKYLNLFRTQIEFSDLQAFVGYNVLPHLISLIASSVDLRTANRRNVDKLFQSRFWRNISVLFLDNTKETSNNIFAEALNEFQIPNLVTLGLKSILKLKNMEFEDFPLETVVLQKCLAEYLEYIDTAEMLGKLNLRTLDISNSSDIDCHLSTLLHYQFTVLTSLNLSNCGLVSRDLRSLAQANLEGRLPELKHLDISKNYAELLHMFSDDCKWNKLLSLDISRTREDYVFEEIRPGYFTSLREIRFSQYQDWHKGVSWPNIRKLCIVDCVNSALYELIDAVEVGYFGELQMVCFRPDKAEQFGSNTVAVLCSLAKTKIECHVTSPLGHPFTSAKCVCQKGNCDNDKPRTTEPKLHLHKQGRNRRIRRVLIDSLLEPIFRAFVLIWIILCLIFRFCYSRTVRLVPITEPFHGIVFPRQ